MWFLFLVGLVMLTITGLSNAEYLISSVALSIDEYYTGVGESPGVWSGRWASDLGLAGLVEAEELRLLVEGRHQTTGTDLLVGAPTPPGAGVRPDVLGAQERVVVVGVGLGPGGRGGSGCSPGGG